MHYLVTGCAGFVGSQWLDFALSQGHKVTGIDNFTTGFHQHLSSAHRSKQFKLIEGSLLNKELLFSVMEGVDKVFHFAANADIRYGLKTPEKDLQQNTIATFNVLEAMRQHQIKTIIFSSTGAIYGDAKQIPTPEDAPFPIQTSLYGASKLAAEGLIQAYSHGYEIQAYIFRFVSLLGARYSHGHVFDFCKQLLTDGSKLEVLGNGLQRKSYLHIADCLAAIDLAIQNKSNLLNIFNLGHPDTCVVNDSINWISQVLGVQPSLRYSGGQRGWIGDSPLIHLDCSRIAKLGFKPKYTIEYSIKDTVNYLLKNQWLLMHRV